MGKKLYVQEGKSCTSKKGILSAGTEVFPKYFENGEEALTRLEKKGVLGSKAPEAEKKEEPKTAETKAEEK